MSELIFQAFEWNTINDGEHWNRLRDMASWIKSQGFTAIWIPPVSKAAYVFDSCDAVGYGVYDLWDLGEFEQCGAIRTKYGTKDELIAMIQEMHHNQINVYVDAVLNHKSGRTEEHQWIQGNRVGDWRLQDLSYDWIQAQISFQFEARAGKYSLFQYQSHHFNSVDAFSPDGFWSCYRLGNWSPETLDSYFGNYDHLVGSDLNLHDPDVIQDLKQWGLWMVNEIGVDGFRIDALRHMSHSFIRDWIDFVNKHTLKNIYYFGEYSGHDFEDELKKLNHTIKLNDFEFQHHLYTKSRYPNSTYDFRDILNSFSFRNPQYSVPFVNSHDSQLRNSDSHTIDDWFRPASYALMLLYQEIDSIVSWGDWFGTLPSISCEKHNHNHDLPAVAGMAQNLEKLLYCYRNNAHGERLTYTSQQNTIGFSRLGVEAFHDSGCVVLIHTPKETTKQICEWMHVGYWRHGQTYRSIFTGQSVVLNEHGWGEFILDNLAGDIWIPENHYLSMMNAIQDYDDHMKSHNHITLYYDTTHGFQWPRMNCRIFEDLFFEYMEPTQWMDPYCIFEINTKQSNGMECYFIGEYHQLDKLNEHENYIAYVGSWIHNSTSKEKLINQRLQKKEDNIQ